MDHPTPDDFSQASVEQLARFLMISAKEDPTLIRRSESLPVDDFFTRIKGLPALLRPRVAQRQPSWDVPSDRDTYLEDLVSLAVTAVRQAEDASREAREASKRARRGRFVFGTVGALGLAAGIAGICLGQFALGGAVEALDLYARNGLRPSVETRHAPVLFAEHQGPNAPPVAATVSAAPVLASEGPPTPADTAPIVPSSQVAAPLEPLHAIYVPPLPLPPNATPIVPASLGNASEPRPLRQTRYVPRPTPHRPTWSEPSPFRQFVMVFQRDIHNLFH
jgi:hypothetical protein